MGIHVQQRTAPRAVPRLRPVWLDMVLSLGWVLWMALSLLGAVVMGFLIGESDPDKYRPFAPNAREKK